MADSLGLSAISQTIFKLFLLMLSGYLLYHFKMVDKDFTDKFSMLLIKVFFPALIMHETITHFSFSEYAYWWLLPLSSILFICFGILIAFILFKFTGKDFSSKNEFLSVCSFQNCGYLPMNLILFSFSGALRNRMLIFVFLFIVGFNLFMWSVVPLILQGRLKKDFNFKAFLNAPVLATVFSLLWVALAGRGSLPHIIEGPLELLGNAAFPISMLTLGAYLACYKAYIPDRKRPLLLAIATKLILLPLVVLILLLNTGLGEDYRLFLFLQSLMPTAVTLVVIGSYANADNKFISSTIFYTHLLAFITVPIWLTIYRSLCF